MYRQAANDYRYPPSGGGGGGGSQFASGPQQHANSLAQQQYQHQQVSVQHQQYQMQQQQQQQAGGQGVGLNNGGGQGAQGGGAGGNNNIVSTDAQSQAASGNSAGGGPPEMNLASVLHYLQSEWRRWERDRNEWEIERAEMRARIALLEGQRRSAENLKVDLLRRVKMLEYALRTERTKTVNSVSGLKSTNTSTLAPSRLAMLQDEEKASTHEKDSGSEGSDESAQDRKPNGAGHGSGNGNGTTGHTAMSRVSTVASRSTGIASDSPWRPIGMVQPPKDPKARARSREYLKQCLQEITYLTSPGALNPLPTRAPIAIDRASSPALSGAGAGAGAGEGGEQHGDPSKVQGDLQERPRKALPEQIIPSPYAVKEEQNPEEAKSAANGNLKSEGENSDRQSGLVNGSGSRSGTNESANSGSTSTQNQSQSPQLPVVTAIDTLRQDAARHQAAPSSPARRSVTLPLDNDTDTPAEERSRERENTPSASASVSPLSQTTITSNPNEPSSQSEATTSNSLSQDEDIQPSEIPSSSTSTSASGISVSTSNITGGGVSTEDSEEAENQNQLLTAIYRPESKIAWREELRAANEQAEKARERSASLSSSVSASSADASSSSTSAQPSGQGQTDEEALQSISLTLPSEDESMSSVGAAPVEKSWMSRRVLKSHLDVVRSVSFASAPPSASGAAGGGLGANVMLVSGGDDCSVKVWAVSAALLRHPNHEIEPISTYRGHTLPITTVLACSPLDQIFSASLDSTIRVWSLPSSESDPYAPYDAGQAVQLLEGHTDAVWDLVVLPPSPVGKKDDVKAKTKASGSKSKSKSSSISASADATSGPGSGAGSLKGKARLVSVGADDTLKVWERQVSPQSQSQKGEIEGKGKDVDKEKDKDKDAQGKTVTHRWVLSRSHSFDATPTCAAEFILELGKVVVGFGDGRVGVVEVEGGEVRWYGEAGTGEQVNAVLCHPTWPVIIAGYEDGYVRIWDAREESKTPKHAIRVHPSAVTSLTIPPTTPDILLTAATDCLIRVWDLNKRTSVQDCQGHRQKADEGVVDVASHPELPFVASAGADGTVRIWSDA